MNDRFPDLMRAEYYLRQSEKNLRRSRFYLVCAVVVLLVQIAVWVAE